MRKSSDAPEKKKKKKKEKFVDDGRTIVDMNVEGMPWYRGKNYDPSNPPPKLTRKERFAVFRGAFVAMIPVVLCTVAGLTVAGILIWLWLH